MLWRVAHRIRENRAGIRGFPGEMADGSGARRDPGIVSADLRERDEIRAERHQERFRNMNLARAVPETGAQCIGADCPGSTSQVVIFGRDAV